MRREREQALRHVARRLVSMQRKLGRHVPLVSAAGQHAPRGATEKSAAASPAAVSLFAHKPHLSRHDLVLSLGAFNQIDTSHQHTPPRTLQIRYAKLLKAESTLRSIAAFPHHTTLL